MATVWRQQSGATAATAIAFAAVAVAAAAAAAVLQRMTERIYVDKIKILSLQAFQRNFSLARSELNHLHLLKKQLFRFTS